jgi:hypothetical protein
MEGTAKYKIKKKYAAHIARYAWTSLDLTSSYTKKEWNAAGFKDEVLEIVNNF